MTWVVAGTAEDCGCCDDCIPYESVGLTLSPDWMGAEEVSNNSGFGYFIYHLNGQEEYVCFKAVIPDGPSKWEDWANGFDVNITDCVDGNTHLGRITYLKTGEIPPEDEYGKPETTGVLTVILDNGCEYVSRNATAHIMPVLRCSIGGRIEQ